MFVIDGGSYPFDTLVCIGQKAEDIYKFIEKTHKLSTEEKENILMDGHGRTVTLSQGQIVLRVDITKNLEDFFAVLAHEIFHAVEFAFARIGIKHSDSSSEAYAYQIEFLFRKIYEKLK